MKKVMLLLFAFCSILAYSAKTVDYQEVDKYIRQKLDKDKEITFIYKVNQADFTLEGYSDEGVLCAITPLDKQPDMISLLQIKSIISEKNGKLKPDEMADSTFTISNLGMYGVKSFVPIINQPNTAILGVSATVPKPVVYNGEVTVRPIMTLTLTADHRVVDGLEGAKFMKTLKEAIENPLSLLI